MGRGICPWCGKEVDKLIMFRGDVVGCRYCGIHTKQTNADRIRAMTDEELDKFLNEVQGDAYLVGFHQRAESRFTPYGKCWLDWLREEAVSDG